MRENREYDYSDRFSAAVRVAKPISAKELSEQFFYAPKWIRGLMNLRNAIMKPFGLKDQHDLSNLVSVKSDDYAGEIAAEVVGKELFQIHVEA